MNVLRKRSADFQQIFDVQRIGKYIHEHCAGEAAEVIRQADLILEDTFVFQDRWDMEPCPVPYTVSFRDWVTTPNGDPEWVFMLNRHDFLNKLQLAYVHTGDERYHEKLRSCLLDWIEKNPITPEGSNATRTIDTGIRCMNWVDILVRQLGGGLFSEEDAARILDSLREQIRNMHRRYIAKYRLSNWGVLQTTAICAASVWLPEVVPEDIGLWAWKELQEQLALQILEDGSHWEQSAMYHVEVLNCSTRLLVFLRYAESCGLSLPGAARYATGEPERTVAEIAAGPGEGYHRAAAGWLTGAIRVMSRHVLYTADPAFFQLPQCDSDVTSVRDVMARAAAWLRDAGIYRFAAGDTMDLDSLWISGGLGLDAFEKAIPAKPKRTAWNCSAGGNLFLRSGWSETAVFTWMKCSSLGSSHGHADQTHLCIYHLGKPFLVDSGRYTYREEDPLRVALKRSSAHNVCVIDGQSGGEPDGSWSYHGYDDVLKHYYRGEKNAHYCEMAFHGTLESGSAYLVKRRVLALEDGIWLSVQDIQCPGEHEVTEYFHLDDAVKVTPEKDGFLLQSGSARLRLCSPESMAMETGILSRRYNEKVEAPLLTKTIRMKDRLVSQTLFADAAYRVNPVPVYQLRRADPLPPEAACAWNVETPDGTKYTLILVNRESFRGDKLYRCQGTDFYGKTLLVTCREEESTLIRLKT